MAVLGNWLVVQRLLTTTLFKLLRLVFVPVQRLYWELNGTARQLRESRLQQNYERSAHVLDVRIFQKFCLDLASTMDDYMFTHNRFENPQYIIDNDNISLMTINDHDAIFCETKEKGVHLWRMKYSSFIRMAQHAYAHRLIVVPLTTFHRMAEKIGDPAGELIFVFNTTRCGSTLLTQIMEYSGRCVAVSEPDSPNVVAMRYRKFGLSGDLRQLARDVIRWECRLYPTMQPQQLAYCLKLGAPSVVALPLFRELYPSSRRLFMYRDTVKVAKSLYRVSMALPSSRIAYVLGRFSGRLTKAAIDSMGFDGSDFCVRLDNDMTFGVVMAAVTTVAYLEMRRLGDDISALRYEDLVARPLDMCRVVLEYCRLPVSLAEHAVKGFNVDSQANSPIAKSIIGSCREPEVTSEIKSRLNGLLRSYGMPQIGEAGILEGTLTCSD